MEYKNIQELYLAVGVAGAIIIVFLGLFTYLVISNDKKRGEQNQQLVDKIGKIVDEIVTLQRNDDDFRNVMTQMVEAIKEVSTTNKIVAETVGKLDYYNRDLHRKVEKHDEKAEKILEHLRR